MAFMEKENVFDKRHAKWFSIAANVHLEDGSKQVCCQKPTCTPTAAAQEYLTTITDVFLLYYVVRLDEARFLGPKKIPRACGFAIAYRQSPAAAVGIVACTHICPSKQPRRFFQPQLQGRKKAKKSTRVV